MSSKKEINRQFLSELSDFISNNSDKKTQSLICDLHIADIAEIIEELSIEQATYLFQLIDEERSAKILIEIEDETREHILSTLSSKEIANKVIENLESDDATDVLSELPKEQKEEILSLIEDDDHASGIEDLLNYPEDTAGGLMAKELIKVNENWTTIRCLKEMRKQSSEIKEVHTIYVVDDHEKLVGTLSLKRLLLTETRILINEIANYDIVSVIATEDDDEVANIMNKYDLIVMPVIDETGVLLGRITIDDVMDVVKEEAEKDYQMASGITEDVESSDSVWQLTRARLPWLLIGLVGGLLGAKVIGIFEIDKNIELAFFIPLIAAMGGNVGVQSAAIVVQGLANESIKINTTLSKLVKELGVALLNGIVCSAIIFGAT
ncbi:MAG: magnesium transporter, partial [Flavobacteriales bacterium]|nr:magnesium transporter [Flavobacteriales bacterium]